MCRKAQLSGIIRILIFKVVSVVFRKSLLVKIHYPNKIDMSKFNSEPYEKVWCFGDRVSVLSKDLIRPAPRYWSTTDRYFRCPIAALEAAF
jgi:hypothetical protein